MTTAPQPDAIRRFAAEAGLDQPGDTCDADTLAARAEFWRMIDDRRGSPQAVGSRQAEAMLREANLLQQIGCTPTNGLAWAELAGLEWDARGWSELVSQYLTLSQRYAPYEGLAVRARLAALIRPDAPRGEAELGLLRRDLATILQFASPREAADEVFRLPREDRTWADAYLETIAPERSSAIRSSIEARAATQAD